MAASGYDSEDEAEGRRAKVNGTSESIVAGGAVNGHSNKRKRSEESHLPETRFRNFQPKVWDGITDKSVESTSRKVKVRMPEPPVPACADSDTKSDGWKDGWLEWRDDGTPVEVIDEKDGREVEVSRRRYVSVKVRRMAKGLERQRIERVVENWTWDSTPTPHVDGDSTVATTTEPVTKDEEMGDP